MYVTILAGTKGPFYWLIGFFTPANSISTNTSRTAQVDCRVNDTLLLFNTIPLLVVEEVQKIL